MKRSWFTETQIISILKEAEAGMTVKGGSGANSEENWR